MNDIYDLITHIVFEKKEGWMDDCFILYKIVVDDLCVCLMIFRGAGSFDGILVTHLKI